MSLTSYRAAPPRAIFVGSGILVDREVLFFVRFGGDLLSHVLRRSTIGVTALNGRVREGIGCLAVAIATKPEEEQEHRALWALVFSFAFDHVLLLLEQIKPIGPLVPVN